MPWDWGKVKGFMGHIYIYIYIYDIYTTIFQHSINTCITIHIVASGNNESNSFKSDSVHKLLHLMKLECKKKNEFSLYTVS